MTNKEVKKDKKKEKRDQFYSITEVERELMPVSSAKKKMGTTNNIKEKMGTETMSEILSSYLD